MSPVRSVTYVSSRTIVIKNQLLAHPSNCSEFARRFEATATFMCSTELGATERQCSRADSIYRRAMNFR